MKITLIGPGVMPIPPSGWGAIEILIHDYRTELERNGWTVTVVNTPDPDDMVAAVSASEPDFVHSHSDAFITALDRIDCPAKAVTSHNGYLDQVWREGPYLRDSYLPLLTRRDIQIFALSPSIRARYLADGADPERVFVTPNGVRSELFRFTDTPSKPDRSLCLAKIYRRKRQGLIQKAGANVDFAGNMTLKTAYACDFDPTRPDYIGEWSKAKVFDGLTDYASLVLVSDGEAHPLVCLEALSAGLGLVLSPAATANLDLTKPFIDVVPEDRLTDAAFVRSTIERNRESAIGRRREIRAYAAEFGYDRIVRRYMALVEKVVESCRDGRITRSAPRRRRRAIVYLPSGPIDGAALAAWARDVERTRDGVDEVNVFVATSSALPVGLPRLPSTAAQDGAPRIKWCSDVFDMAEVFAHDEVVFSAVLDATLTSSLCRETATKLVALGGVREADRDDTTVVSAALWGGPVVIVRAAMRAIQEFAAKGVAADVGEGSFNSAFAHLCECSLASSVAISPWPHEHGAYSTTDFAEALQMVTVPELLEANSSAETLVVASSFEKRASEERNWRTRLRRRYTIFLWSIRLRMRSALLA
jgi:hypothetical protein